VWQAIVVGLIVLVATLYAAWTLLPAGLRLRLATRLGAWGRRPGRAAWLACAAGAIERRAGARHGACSDCSAVQAAPGPPDDHTRP
jgi:hypothetical protein